MRRKIIRFLEKLGVIRLLGKLNLVKPASLIYGAIKNNNLSAISNNMKYFKTGFKHNGLPIPPFSMRFYVSGSFDIDWFMKIGKEGADAITDVLKENNVDIDQFDDVLDFGCGCGRVFRHWSELKHAKVHGCDYNPDLLGWCRDNLKYGDFKINQLDPPLPFEDNQFDFIYALSVFTHLPEDTQFAWIAEWTRVLRPNGYILFTLHGESYLEALTPEEQQQFKEVGLVLKNEEISGTNYCNAYHRYEYVKEKLVPGFTIVSFIPEGARGNPHQDLYLLKKN